MEGILLSKFVVFIVSEWDSESVNNCSECLLHGRHWRSLSG